MWEKSDMPQKDEKRYFEAQGIHKPIISEEIYEETQALIKKLSTKVYKKHPKENHYYAGFLTCGICGEKLVVHRDYKKDIDGNNIPRSYRCRNRLNKTCSASDISHRNTEKAFIEYIENIEDFNALDEIQLSVKEKTKNENLERIKKFQKEYKKLEGKAKEVLNLYINGELDFNEYNEIKTAIAKEKQQISSALKKAETCVNKEISIKQEDIIRNLKENWNYLN